MFVNLFQQQAHKITWRSIAHACVLGGVLAATAACAPEPDGRVVPDGKGGSVVSFAPPSTLTQLRMPDDSAITPVITVDNNSVSATTEDQQTWSATIRAVRGDSLLVVITWKELFQGQLLDLAQASENYTVPVNPDGELVIQFSAGDYYIGFDSDFDGVSNLAERNNGTDPTDPNSTDPIVRVPLVVSASMPDLLVDASNDIKTNLLAVAQVDRRDLVLEFDGSAWRGETLSVQDSDVLINFTVYASNARDIPLARWQNTRNVASGITVTINDVDYEYDVFNTDGDDLNNIQEVLAGFNPLDFSDPAIDPCAESNFNAGCIVDTDGDGDIDSVETETADEDEDGIPDYLEPDNVDADDDGFGAEQDPDENNPCVPSVETVACQNLGN